MTGLVFVDTNILLHTVDSREAAKHTRAREWLESLWRTRSGRTSAQVLSEFFVNATQRLEPGLTPDEAWQQVSGLRAWRPHAIDFETVELGRQLQVRYRLSWWDSLVVAAARLQGCSILLTEDLQHGSRFAGVTRNAREPDVERAQRVNLACLDGFALEWQASQYDVDIDLRRAMRQQQHASAAPSDAGTASGTN